MTETFADRRKIEAALLQKLTRGLWTRRDTLASGVRHCRADYRTLLRKLAKAPDVDRLPGEADAAGAIADCIGQLARGGSRVALFLEHLPDAFIQKDGRLLWIDYKAARTPRFTPVPHAPGVPFENFAPIEFASWNVLAWLRHSVGLDVALLVWAPFHSRPLVMNWPVDARHGSKNWSEMPKYEVQATTTVSGTDYAAVDIGSWPSLAQFLDDELNIHHGVTERLLWSDLDVWANDDELLKMRPDARDPNRDRRAGWNWTDEFLAPPAQTGLFEKKGA